MLIELLTFSYLASDNLNMFRSLPILNLVILAGIVTGCSHIHYKSEGKIPVKVSRSSEHDQIFETTGSVGFYLFGYLPPHQTVAIDQLAQAQGFSEISKLVITETSEWDDLLWSFLSLGFYTPRSYKIWALGKRM